MSTGNSVYIVFLFLPLTEIIRKSKRLERIISERIITIFFMKSRRLTSFLHGKYAFVLNAFVVLFKGHCVFNMGVLVRKINNRNVLDNRHYYNDYNYEVFNDLVKALGLVPRTKYIALVDWLALHLKFGSGYI